MPGIGQPAVPFMLIFYCCSVEGKSCSAKIPAYKTDPFCCLEFTSSQFNVVKKYSAYS